MKIIEKAIEQGRTTLSEFESKALLSHYSVPVTREFLVQDLAGLINAARQLGYPLVLKGCSPSISHKTEMGLVCLDIRSDAELTAAFEELASKMGAPPGDHAGQTPAMLVQEMVKGERELMVGLTRDAQFGPCVMFGLGGILTEVLEDVAFRMAPLTVQDALQMMGDIRANKILGPIRNMGPVDLDAMARLIVNVGRIGLECPQVKEIDINPIKIRGTQPIAVDALVVL